MKTMLIGIIAFLLLATNAFALQEVAGPLVITVPVGGSNSAQWGLSNDGNKLITVSLNATGDAAQYLSFPQTVDLQPGKIVYVNVTATLPSDYNLGQNITGTLSALQEGQPGQVQINVQMTKSVTITASFSKQNSPIAGLVALVSGNYVVIGLVIALILIAIAFFAIRKFPRKH